MEKTANTRKAPRYIEGVVVSDKMNKTRVIAIRRTKQHSLYGKKLVRTKKLFVHDEKNTSKVGDKIRAVVCRPLAKNKNFRLVKVLESRVVA